MYDFIEITNAKVIFPNFDGHKDNFGNVGRKSVVLEIDEAQAQKLIDAGASVVVKNFEDGSVSFRLPAAINYRKKDGTLAAIPPKVYRVVIRDGKPFSKYLCDEESVAMLQKATILYVDAVINLWEWDKNDHKKKAYISELYVSVVESKLATQFSDVPDVGSDAPAFVPNGDEPLPF